VITLSGFYNTLILTPGKTVPSLKGVVPIEMAPLSVCPKPFRTAYWKSIKQFADNLKNKKVQKKFL
jgi:hypothetical protein